MTGQDRAATAFLAPFGAGVVALVVLPAAITFGYALTDATGLNSPSFTGLANVRRLLSDPFLPASLRASLVHVALAVPLRMAVAVGLGLLLAAPRRGGRWYRVAVYLPTVIPDVALSLLALWAFNPLLGPVNRLLGAVGLPQPLWFAEPWGARLAVVIMLAFPIGEAFLVVLAMRRRVPASLYDAAALAGLGPWAQLRHVTLPVLSPVLVLLAIRDVVLTLQVNFVPGYLLTDGRPANATLYLPVYIYDQAFEFSGFGYAALLTVLLMAVTTVLIATMAWLARRWGLLGR